MKSEKTSQIIDKIKKEGIKPIPKWKANFSNYLYWAFLIILILIGGFFASFLIMDYFNVLPEIARQVNLQKFFFIVFTTAPLLWIILLFLSLFFAFLAYRKTKKGYRHKITSIIILLVLIISFLAFLNHITKINNHMERFLENQGPPRFNRFAPPREDRFFNPGEGMISGEIEKIEGNNLLIENSHTGEEWTVIISPDTKIKRAGHLSAGSKIIVIGEKLEDGTFQAKAIVAEKPFSPPPPPPMEDAN